MKKLSKIMCLLIILIPTVIIHSCSENQDDYLDLISTQITDSIESAYEYKFFDKSYLLVKNVPAWKSQINKLVDNSFLMMDQSGLVLESYKYIKEIENINEFEEIKSQITSNFRFFPDYEEGMKKFTIKENVFSIEKTGLYIDQKIKKVVVQDSTKSSNYNFKNLEYGILEIKWDFKGDSYITRSIVSDKYGILYDNILTFLCLAKEKTSQTDGSLIKTQRAEVKTNGLKKEWVKTKEARNFAGDLFYYFKWHVNLEGKEYWDDTKSITQVTSIGSEGNTQLSILGYGIDHGIRDLKLNSSPDGYFKFSYYGVCSLGSWSVTFSEIGGFSVTSSDGYKYKIADTYTIDADQLN